MMRAVRMGIIFAAFIAISIAANMLGDNDEEGEREGDREGERAREERGKGSQGLSWSIAIAFNRPSNWRNVSAVR